MTKLEKAVEDIIKSPVSYWIRLRQLREIKVNGRSGADTVREMLRDFMSTKRCPDGVSRKQWEYIWTALVHPYFGVFKRREYDDWVLYEAGYRAWQPRGGKCMCGERLYYRRERFLKARYPELVIGENSAAPFRGGYFQRFFREYFQKINHQWDTFSLSRRDRQRWWQLIQAIDQKYAEWQIWETQSSLLPMYFGHGLSLAVFQREAPRMVKQNERGKHIEKEQWCPESPYTVFQGHYMTITIEDHYLQDYAEYSYGAGVKEKTTRRMCVQNATGCAYAEESTWRVSAKMVGQVVVALEDENLNRQGQQYYRPYEVSVIQKELQGLEGRSWRTVKEFKAAMTESVSRVFFNGSYMGGLEKLLLKYVEKTCTGFTGNWLSAFLVRAFDLPKVTVSRALKRVQLQPYFQVRMVRAYPGGYQLYERRLGDARWDWCLYVPTTQETFHADTRRACVKGLREKRRKTMLTEKIQSGEALTAKIVQEKYGFCMPGIRDFCQMNELDVASAYLRKELESAIAQHLDENQWRFGRELQQMELNI